MTDWRSDLFSSNQIHQPSAIVAKRREQEAAPVADIGVVIAELVAVIAQRERCGQIIGQGFEPAEMGDPLGVAQRVQPHARRRAIVAEAPPRPGKARGLDRFVEYGAEYEAGVRKNGG